MNKKIFAVLTICFSIFALVGCADPRLDKIYNELYGSNTHPTQEIQEEEEPKYIDPSLYTEEKLEEIGNVQLKYVNHVLFTSNSPMKIYADVIFGDKTDTSNASDLIFYLFESTKDADNAFWYAKSNRINQYGAIIEDDYVIGQDIDEPSFELFFYKTNNVIIYKNVRMKEIKNPYNADVLDEESEDLSATQLRYLDILHTY